MMKIISNNEVNVNGSRVFIENGKVKTVLSEEIQRTGYMSVDEIYQLIDSRIKMIYGIKDETQSDGRIPTIIDGRRTNPSNE